MQCDLCGKQFKHLDHLNRHRREIHQNKYRYHCEKCGHGVAKLSYLKAHKCGRIRRAQSSQCEPDKNDSNQTRLDTAKETQSVNSENEQSERFVYSDELFTGTQDKPAEGTFVLGVYDPPVCSSATSLYQLPDGLQSLSWTPNASAELIIDNNSSNALLSSLLSNL